MSSSRTIDEQEVEDDHDFVAVPSHKSKNNTNNNTTFRKHNSNNKGKGRYIPPVEKPLSELPQQKIGLLQSSVFFDTCKRRFPSYLYLDALQD